MAKKNVVKNNAMESVVSPGLMFQSPTRNNSSVKKVKDKRENLTLVSETYKDNKGSEGREDREFSQNRDEYRDIKMNKSKSNNKFTDVNTAADSEFNSLTTTNDLFNNSRKFEGELSDPVLNVLTTYDPILPPGFNEIYKFCNIINRFIITYTPFVS